MVLTNVLLVLNMGDFVYRWIMNIPTDFIWRDFNVAITDMVICLTLRFYLENLV